MLGEVLQLMDLNRFMINMQESIVFGLFFIVVYNLPPSMCMKDQFIFMPLIIPGDRNPAKDLNVYLRPLIDELKCYGTWE